MNYTESNPGQIVPNSQNKNPFDLHRQGLENFSNVCRICASIAIQVYPIYDEQGQQDDLAEKINKHLPIKVSKEDGLPQVICYQCHSTILAWDELVKCSIQAKMVLQEKLSVMRLLDPEKTTNKKEAAESNKTTTHDGINLDCVKNENDLDKPTEVVHDKCDQQKENIEKPLNIVTKDGKKYGVCEVCKKNISIASWKRHLRSHQAVKRYSCHTCGLGFNDSGNLSRHRRALHAALRPHTCHICHKSFSRNSHLEDHIKSHSDSREYVCDMCGKASKSSTALRMHRKIHEDEYRFRCIYCESKFKRRGQLLAHVTVHTGEKAHICACGKAFRLKSQLTAHSRTHRVKEIPLEP